MAVETTITRGTDAPEFVPSPIRTSWILAGDPVARVALLSSSADGMASTYYWDCTAGRFHWFYDVDETAYVLEGSVTIKDKKGVARRVGAGDWIFFPKGSFAEWTVHEYVRKVAFCRSPMPGPVHFALGVYRVLKKLTGRGSNGAEATAMFHG